VRRGERDANVANFDNRVDGFELLAEELLRASDVAGVPLHEANLFRFGLETDTFLFLSRCAKGEEEARRSSAKNERKKERSRAAAARFVPSTTSRAFERRAKPGTRKKR
jgi:hypothetical protein